MEATLSDSGVELRTSGLFIPCIALGPGLGGVVGDRGGSDVECGLDEA